MWRNAFFKMSLMVEEVALHLLSPPPATALKNADALDNVTEWKELRSLDFPLIKKKLKFNIFYHGRNMYERSADKAPDIMYQVIVPKL